MTAPQFTEAPAPNPLAFLSSNAAARLVEKFRADPSSRTGDGVFAKIFNNVALALCPDLIPDSTAPAPSAPSKPVAVVATTTPAPAVTAGTPTTGCILSPENRRALESDPDVIALDKAYRALTSDSAREAFVDKLLLQMKNPVEKQDAKASAPPAPEKPLPPNTVRLSSFRKMTPTEQSALMRAKVKLLDDTADIKAAEVAANRAAAAASSGKVLTMAQFNKLSHTDRSAHFRNGGKLVD